MPDLSPVLVSAPAARFQQNANDLLNFLRFVVSSIEALQRNTNRLLKVIENLGNIPGTRFDKELVDKWTQDIEGGRPNPITEFEKNLPLQYELVFCRSVDNFLTYVSELLALIFSVRPEMLKSEEKIAVSEVLEYADMKEFLEAFTERKVIGLSRKSMTDLHNELDRNFGFILFDDAGELEEAAIMIEKRNLAIHNRGCVNRHYLERVPSATESLGDKLTFETVVFASLKFFMTIVFKLDQKAADKFNIPRDTPLPVFGVAS